MSSVLFSVSERRTIGVYRKHSSFRTVPDSIQPVLLASVVFAVTSLLNLTPSDDCSETGLASTAIPLQRHRSKNSGPCAQITYYPFTALHGYKVILTISHLLVMVISSKKRAFSTVNAGITTAFTSGCRPSFLFRQELTIPITDWDSNYPIPVRVRRYGNRIDFGNFDYGRYGLLITICERAD
jgi:hypothetical protein